MSKSNDTNTRPVQFPTDWFPYGATLVSTMTRWGHCGQDLKEWVAELSSDLESMKRHGMTSVGIMMDWELIEPAEGQFDFRKFDPITAIQGESPHVV